MGLLVLLAVLVALLLVTASSYLLSSLLIYITDFKSIALYLLAVCLIFGHAAIWYMLMPDPVSQVIAGMLAGIAPGYFMAERLRVKDL